MRKLLTTAALVVALGLSSTAANAGFLHRNTGPGPDMSWLNAVTAQRKKFEDADNYRSCVNLYGGTSAAVNGCQRVWNNKLPNAANNDNYRRCVNMYGTGPCQKVWAGKL